MKNLYTWCLLLALSSTGLPAQEVYLTGIDTLFAKPEALLSIQGESTTAITLQLGDTSHGITLLSVGTRTATIQFQGTTQTLSLSSAPVTQPAPPTEVAQATPKVIDYSTQVESSPETVLALYYYPDPVPVFED